MPATLETLLADRSDRAPGFEARRLDAPDFAFPDFWGFVLAS